MEIQLALSREEMENFKCYFCGNYLSVGPVMTKSHRYAFKCGRCEEIDGENSTRHVGFETLVKYHSFPCIYRKCKQSIPWGEVAHHEENCHHRTILCPGLFTTPCKRNIKITTLCAHFMEKHSDNLYYDKVIYTYKENPGNITFLLVKETFQYVVYVYRVARYMYISVFSIDSGPYTKFEVTFSAMCNDAEVGPTLLFSNRKIGRTVYKCLNKPNISDDYKIGQISEAFGAKIDESCIRYCLKQNKVQCTVNLIKETPSNEDDESGALDTKSKPGTCMSCKGCIDSSRRFSYAYEAQRCSFSDNLDRSRRRKSV